MKQFYYITVAAYKTRADLNTSKNTCFRGCHSSPAPALATLV